MPRRVYGNKAKEPIYTFLDSVEDVVNVKLEEIVNATGFSKTTAQAHLSKYCVEHNIQRDKRPKSLGMIPQDVWDEWDKTIKEVKKLPNLANIPLVERC